MPLFRRSRFKHRRLTRREWARRQLRRISILPSLMTVANGVFGLAAIHAVTRYVAGGDGLFGIQDGFLVAGVFIVLAMVADMLDGRIARFTRQTTDFGGQLDSLSDVVSFGVAPAVIIYHMVAVDLTDIFPAAGHGAPLLSGPAGQLIGRFTWLATAAYFGCAALRLARFNVENVHDESAHLWFKGLPSPGAAAAMASMTLLRHTLFAREVADGWRLALALALPIITLALGLLMVSRYRYQHLVNQYLAGRRSFGHLARLMLAGVVIIAAVLWIGPEFALVAGVMLYAFSGAIAGVYRQIRGLPLQPPAPTKPAEPAVAAAPVPVVNPADATSAPAQDGERPAQAG